MRAECPECGETFRIPTPENGRRVKCPECGIRFDPLEDDENDDDDDRYPVRGSGKKKRFPIVEVVGGSIAAVVAIGIVIFVIVSRPKAEPVAAARGGDVPPAFQQPFVPPAPALIRPESESTKPKGVSGSNLAKSGKKTPENEDAEQTNPELATGATETKPKNEIDQLFLLPVTRKPPKIRAGLLDTIEQEPPLEVPSFYSLRMARQTSTKAVNSKAGRLTREEVKQATVYIKVEAGDMASTGSGFLIWLQNGEAFIATNHHVIKRGLQEKTDSGAKTKISVVFNSGIAGLEQEYQAKVLAFDPFADLAILRVTPTGKMPKPIEPWAGPKPVEEMPVRIFGFPFGENLSTNGGNPNISVNPGAVSSLRLDKAERLSQIQISGPLNPGNSGGPIVDNDGRLIGIAVATIKGSGLGFAVPVHELVALLEGKLLTTLFLPTGIESNNAKFMVMIPVMDPLSHVKKVYIRYWTGQGAKPKAIKDPKMGYKPIEPAQQIALLVPDLPTSLTFALGDLKIPKDATEVVIQIASENDNSLTAASIPVTYKLKLTDIHTGTDAKPFTELTSKIDSLADQVIVVRGKILSAPASRGEVQELSIGDLDSKRPSGIRFLTSRDLATQFDEIDSEDQDKAVRLTCVVGKRDAEGIVAVRVARVDYLAKGDRIERTIPDEAEPKDELAKLNRNPEKYSGKSMELVADSVPMTQRTKGSNQLIVLFPHLAQPRNLQFETMPGLSTKIFDEKLASNMIYRSRLSIKVGKAPRPGAPTPIVVRKIELMDKDDKVYKTIE